MGEGLQRAAKAARATGRLKPKTVEMLVKRGYLPRAVAAERLRAMADSIEHGNPEMFIRTPAARPHLWVRLDIRVRGLNGHFRIDMEDATEDSQ